MAVDDNISAPMNLSYRNVSDSEMQGKAASSYAVYEDVLNTYVILIICVFGVAGNIVNIVVLRMQSRSSSPSSCSPSTAFGGNGNKPPAAYSRMSRMEKSAHFALLALSVSDLLFCTVTLPHAFCWKKQSSSGGDVDVRLLYSMYSNAILNTFGMCSTWLTVMMAASRYLAICHPFKARAVIGLKFSRACTFAIVLFSVLLNVPRYFFSRLENVDLDDGTRYYFIMPGPVQQYPKAEKCYLWIYFILAILLPLCILTFSNIKLIQTLRFASRRFNNNTTTPTTTTSLTIRGHHPQQQQQKPQFQSTSSTSSSHQVITLLLVIIVTVYTLCLVPAEIANFIKYLQIVGDNIKLFNLILAILNTFQAANFACNFILYCSLNAEFRRKFVQLVTSCCRKPQTSNDKQNNSRMQSSFFRTKDTSDMELQPLDENCVT